MEAILQAAAQLDVEVTTAMVDSDHPSSSGRCDRLKHSPTDSSSTMTRIVTRSGCAHKERVVAAADARSHAASDSLRRVSCRAL